MDVFGILYSKYIWTVGLFCILNATVKCKIHIKNTLCRL